MRPLAPLALAGLLAACAGEPVAPPPQTTKPVPTAALETALVPVPAHLRELSGNLLDIPSGAEVELALLTINERGIPQDLLGTLQLRGSGAPLPFRLTFDPASVARGIRVELRGRAHLAGRLILRLPPLAIRHADSQSLGELQLVPAP